MSTALLWFLLFFAQQHSGYNLPPNTPLPHIRAATAQELNTRQYYHQHWKAQTNMETGEIVFMNTPNPNDSEDVCAMAHELTHYLQFVNRMKLIGKDSNLEVPAYMTSFYCYKIIYKDSESAIWSIKQISKYLNNDIN